MRKEHHLLAICVMGNDTEPRVCFGDRTIKEQHKPYNEGTDEPNIMRERGREKKDKIKLQMQPSFSEEREKEREKAREREREVYVLGGYDVVKKCKPSCRMQTAFAE